nr:basic proline-rich protein-like [Caretta caretta]
MQGCLNLNVPTVTLKDTVELPQLIPPETVILSPAALRKGIYPNSPLPKTWLLHPTPGNYLPQKDSPRKASALDPPTRQCPPHAECNTHPASSPCRPWNGCGRTGGPSPRYSSGLAGASPVNTPPARSLFRVPLGPAPAGDCVAVRKDPSEGFPQPEGDSLGACVTGAGAARGQQQAPPRDSRGSRGWTGPSGLLGQRAEDSHRPGRRWASGSPRQALPPPGPPAPACPAEKRLPLSSRLSPVPARYSRADPWVLSSPQPGILLRPGRGTGLLGGRARPTHPRAPPPSRGPPCRLPLPPTPSVPHPAPLSMFLWVASFPVQGSRGTYVIATPPR